MLKKIIIPIVITLSITSCEFLKKEETPKPVSDFNVSSFTVLSNNVSSGDVIEVKITVNTKKDNIDFLFYNFYLSTDNVYSVDSDIKLNKPQIPKIINGENKISLKLTIPVSINSSDYYLLFRYKDPSKEDAEYSVMPVLINIKKPVEAFTFVGISLSKNSYKGGETIVYTVTGKNTFSSTKTIQTYFYFSSDNQASSDDYFTYTNYAYFETGFDTYVGTYTLPTLTSSKEIYVLAVGLLELNPSSFNEEYSVTSIVSPIISLQKSITINYSSVIGTNFLLGDDINILTNLKSEVSFSQYLYFNYYLSKDSIRSNDDVKINSYSSSRSIYSNTTSVIDEYTLSSSSLNGNYYLITEIASSYDFQNSSFFIAGQINITKLSLSSILSLTSFNTDKSEYYTGERIYTTLNISNNKSESYYLSGGYYLSTDTIYDSNDKYMTSESNYLYSGSNTFTDDFSISDSQNGGNYYILYYGNCYIAGNYIYDTFVGPKIDIKEPILSISGISLLTTITSANSNLTALLSIVSEKSSSMYIDYYFSTDQNWSIDDYSISSSNYEYVNSGTNLKEKSISISSSIPSGKYYLIARYRKDYNTDNETISSQNTIEIKPFDAILYRSKYSSTYLYLFIDDTFVATLSDYMYSGSFDCTSSFYSGAHFKFYGSNGEHTYKLRTASSLNSGSEIKSGTFTVGSSCQAIIVD